MIRKGYIVKLDGVLCLPMLVYEIRADGVVRTTWMSLRGKICRADFQPIELLVVETAAEAQSITREFMKVTR